MKLSITGIKRRQYGYVLGVPTLGLAFSLGAIGTVTADWAEQSGTQSTLTAQVSAYAQINRALGNYVTLYYPQLSDVAAYPDACSTVTFRAGSWVPGGGRGARLRGRTCRQLHGTHVGGSQRAFGDSHPHQAAC